MGGAPGGNGGGKKNRGGKGKKKADPEVESEEEEEIDTKQLAFNFGGADGKFDFASLAKDLQDKLGAHLDAAKVFLDSLPAQVRGRVSVLKSLQDDRRALEAEFRKEYAALQAKYRDLYQPLYDKRTGIITGTVEPTNEEVAAAKVKEEEHEKKQREEQGLPEPEAKKEEEKKAEVKTEGDVKGVPSFWLKAIQNHVDLRDMVEPDDHEALSFLTDVRWHPLPEEPASFVLEFYFAENPFFEERVLAKTYHMIETADTGDLHFNRLDPPTITWKAGKNLCVKQVTKQQKKRGGRRGKGPQTRTITVEEPVNSFFHFFNPEAFLNLQPDLEEDDYEQFLEDDYVMGTEFKEKLIPFAVLYYTGEMEQDEPYPDEDEDDEGDDDDEEPDEDDEDEDEDEDDEDHGRHSHGRGGHRHGHGHSHGHGAPAGNAAKPECNQQ